MARIRKTIFVTVLAGLCGGLVAAPKIQSVKVTILNFGASHQVDILACYDEPDITHALGEIRRIDNCINNNKTRDVKLKKGRLTAVLDISYKAPPPLVCGVFSVKDENGKTNFPGIHCVPFSKDGDPVRKLKLDTADQTIKADY